MSDLIGSEKVNSYMVHDDENVKGFFGDYRWLSNFHESKVFFRGEQANSVEAAYQAAKMPGYGDFCAVMHMSPRDAKKAGQTANIDVSLWNEAKRFIMYECLVSKFLLDEELREKLLATGSKYLEETNHWKDTYWGVTHHDGKGENMLGRLLMNVRSSLAKLS